MRSIRNAQTEGRNRMMADISDWFRKLFEDDEPKPAPKKPVAKRPVAKQPVARQPLTFGDLKQPQGVDVYDREAISQGLTARPQQLAPRQPAQMKPAPARNPINDFVDELDKIKRSIFG